MKSVLLAWFLCVPAFGIRVSAKCEAILTRPSTGVPQLIVKSFTTLGLYSEIRFEEMFLDAMLGAAQGDSALIRNTVQRLGHEQNRMFVWSKYYLDRLGLMLSYAAQEPRLLAPYNADVRIAYKQFITAQLWLKKEDPHGWKNDSACRAAYAAKAYFKKMPHVAFEFQEYLFLLECHRP